MNALKNMICLLVFVAFTSNIWATSTTNTTIESQPLAALQSPVDTGKYVVVFMINGNEYKGKVLKETAQTLTVETLDLGELELFKDLIKRVVEVDEENIARLYRNNYQAIDTRYFFGTNGFSVNKNAGYYQNTWVFFNQFNYGLTDNLSVGGGVVPLFLFGEFGGEITPFWGTVKYSIPMPYEKFHLSVGSLFGRIGTQEDSGFGLLFTQATFGTPDANINLGVGYGFAGGELASRPTVTLSGLWKMNNNMAFISENYLISSEFGDTAVITSAGLRFYLKKVSIDAALVRPLPTDGGFWALPWLGISVPLGKY